MDTKIVKIEIPSTMNVRRIYKALADKYAIDLYKDLDNYPKIPNLAEHSKTLRDYFNKKARE